MFEDAAYVIVTVSAVVVAVGVITRQRPMRWLGRTLVAEPLERKVDEVVTRVVQREVPAAVDAVLKSRPLTNGWGTRAVEAIASAVGANVEPPEPEPPRLEPGESPSPTEDESS